MAVVFSRPNGEAAFETKPPRYLYYSPIDPMPRIDSDRNKKIKLISMFVALILGVGLIIAAVMLSRYVPSLSTWTWRNAGIGVGIGLGCVALMYITGIVLTKCYRGQKPKEMAAPPECPKKAFEKMTAIDFTLIGMCLPIKERHKLLALSTKGNRLQVVNGIRDATLFELRSLKSTSLDDLMSIAYLLNRSLPKCARKTVAVVKRNFTELGKHLGPLRELNVSVKNGKAPPLSKRGIQRFFARIPGGKRDQIHTLFCDVQYAQYKTVTLPFLKLLPGIKRLVVNFLYAPEIPPLISPSLLILDCLVSGSTNVLVSLMERCRDLRSLGLGQIQEPVPLFAAVGQRLTKLAHLSFFALQNTEGFDFQALRSCPDLTSLYIHGHERSILPTVFSILPHVPSLRRLGLEYQIWNEEKLLSLPEPLLMHTPNIEYLKLGSIYLKINGFTAGVLQKFALLPRLLTVTYNTFGRDQRPFPFPTLADFEPQEA